MLTNARSARPVVEIEELFIELTEIMPTGTNNLNIIFLVFSHLNNPPEILKPGDNDSNQYILKNVSINYNFLR